MLLSLQHDQAFRISRPRWKVKKILSRSGFAEVSLCASVSANVTVILSPAFSQPTAIIPVLLCASALTFTILVSARLNPSNKKFKKWNTLRYFTFMCLNMRRHQNMPRMAQTLCTNQVQIC